MKITTWISKTNKLEPFGFQAVQVIRIQVHATGPAPLNLLGLGVQCAQARRMNTPNGTVSARSSFESNSSFAQRFSTIEVN